VTPVNAERDAGLRYGEWEYTRRQEVEKLGSGQIGYVICGRWFGRHRAMGRDFYPAFNRRA